MKTRKTKKTPLLIGILLAFAGQGHAQDIGRLDFRNPIRISGSVNLQLEHYSASGIELRRKPFSWMLSGSPTVTVLDVPIPLTVLFSNFENRFYQPFNQYGVSPRFKWVTLHAGYRNVQFSPFTLAGHRMLGGGFEANPGKLRAGFMYGRLAKSTELDSAQFANPLAFRPVPTYTRMAYAGKVGFGSERNYVDVSFLKGWDRAGSLGMHLRDSVAPAENVAIGLSWRMTVFKDISWQADLGISHYTDNSFADKLMLDSTYPSVVRRLTDAFSTNISSRLLAAGETRLSYQGRIVGMSVQYRRIDPEYQSMGAYFFQSDVEQYSVAPSLRLLNGRLLFNGNAGFQRDNLYRQKLATSERFIGMVNINYMPTQAMGVNFSYTNFGVTQNPLRTSPGDDIFKQVSRLVMLTPYLNLADEHAVRSLQLIASYQSLNSPVKTINTAPDQHTLFGTAVYSHTWLRRQLSVNASANFNRTDLAAGAVGSFGGGVGATAPLWKRQLTLTTGATYNSNTFNGVANGYTLNGNAGVSARFWKRNTVQLSVNYLKNESNDQSAIQSFDETVIRMGYGISF